MVQFQVLSGTVIKSATSLVCIINHYRNKNSCNVVYINSILHQQLNDISINYTVFALLQNIYIYNSNRNYKKLTKTTMLIEKRIGIG